MADNKKPVHAVPHTEGWAVRREGNQRVSLTYRTQAEAEQAGRDIARRDQTEFFLHRRDGTVRQRDSYGNDPNPPKDKD